MALTLNNTYQGGKAYGLLKVKQEGRLEEINKEFLCDPKFSDEEDLEEKLAVFKGQAAAAQPRLVPTGAPLPQQAPPRVTVAGRVKHHLIEKALAEIKKYMEFDLNNQGEIDLMSVKRMMEKLGAPKTHLELKRMISEVTGGVGDTISYQDFVNVMLGKRSAVLKLVMMFEGKANENSPKPLGPPPERDIASLP